MYSKIMVAVDIATDAQLILAKSKALADLHGAEVVLVHVTEPTALAAAMMGPEGLGMVAEEAELDDRLMAAARAKMAELAGAAGLGEAALRVELGIPSDGLVRLAEEIGADLIVIGHHERRGLASFLGTGTDRGVLHHAPCDVLAVRA